MLRKAFLYWIFVVSKGNLQFDVLKKISSDLIIYIMVNKFYDFLLNKARSLSLSLTGSVFLPSALSAWLRVFWATQLMLANIFCLHHKYWITTRYSRIKSAYDAKCTGALSIFHTHTKLVATKISVYLLEAISLALCVLFLSSNQSLPALQKICWGIVRKSSRLHLVQN